MQRPAVRARLPSLQLVGMAAKVDIGVKSFTPLGTRKAASGRGNGIQRLEGKDERC